MSYESSLFRRTKHIRARITPIRITGLYFLDFVVRALKGIPVSTYSKVALDLEYTMVTFDSIITGDQRLCVLLAPSLSYEISLCGRKQETLKTIRSSSEVIRTIHCT